MSELEILYPEPVTVLVGRRKVKILPVRLRHFRRYGVQAAALIEVFAGLSIQQINRYAERHAAELRQLLLDTTSLTRIELWFMSTAVTVQLVAEVVRVNSAFFGEALPQVARVLGGLESSSASSAQGTA